MKPITGYLSCIMYETAVTELYLNFQCCHYGTSTRTLRHNEIQVDVGNYCITKIIKKSNVFFYFILKCILKMKRQIISSRSVALELEYLVMYALQHVIE